MPVQSSVLSRIASRCDDQPNSIGSVEPSTGDVDILFADILAR
jgi:hypothetical protein